MRRREFVVLFGGAAVAGPVTGWAQPGKLPRIGVLALGNLDPGLFFKEFREGLRELGYVEGQSMAFEFRSAAGDSKKLATLAAELVALRVDIIAAFQTPAVTAAKQATAEIPIVMAGVGDPVGSRFVASLARPGGNLTGMSGATAELGGKNLELIREALPAARRVAVLVNVPDPFHKPFLENMLASGRMLGLEIKPILLRGAEEIDAGFAETTTWRTEAVIVQPSLPHKRFADAALKHRLPALAPHSDFSLAGGLMSYSANSLAMYRESASFVDKILKGRKPADLPVQLATKFQLVINLKTANALGLTLPPTLLTRADQVIE
jgi:putative ABC transport system substrate-binding protein